MNAWGKAIQGSDTICRFAKIDVINEFTWIDGTSRMGRYWNCCVFDESIDLLKMIDSVAMKGDEGHSEKVLKTSKGTCGKMH